MSTLLLIVALVVLLLALVSGGMILNRERKLRRASRNLFAAVSIVYDDAAACPEVKAYAGKRLLSADAPELPLPNCSAESCACSFHHFSDRRKGPRRVKGDGLFGMPYLGPDRRQRRGGRRSDDNVRDVTGAFEQDGSHADTYFGHHDKTGVFHRPSKT